MVPQPLMDSEQLIAKYRNCKCLDGDGLFGSLEFTTFRLVFKPIDGSAISSSHDVPLNTILSVDLKRSHKTSQSKQQHVGVFITCKDMRFLRFVLPDVLEGEELGAYLKEAIRPTQRSQPLFAYVFAEACIRSNLYLTSGWDVYSPEEEYHRQNVVNNGWRITKVNEGYKLCRTYPEVLAVPAKVSDDLLIKCAPHRSRGRIPVLSWLHPESRASLTRSAQPLSGLQGRRNEHDEDLVRSIREANANTVNLLVFDARTQFTAVANRGRGGGVESPAFYTNIQYSFMNIPNLHSMRASFTKLATATTVSSTAVPSSPFRQDGGGAVGGGGGTNWLKSIHETKWLYHIQQILTAAAAAAYQIENHKSSVLVHCSDGWDRTSQVTSLAMLMLDPYYRTLRGFQVLVEKEWISFGHKFAERTGGPADGGNLVFPWSSGQHSGDVEPVDGVKVEQSNSEQRSPIFLQFVDCVWQMMTQFPASFEFNERFLITILDELYSARFGTFLFNSECEARDSYAHSRTISLWGYVNAYTRDFLNPTYTPAEVSGHRLLIPSATSQGLELWKRYYLRWQPSVRCQEPVDSLSARVLDRMTRFKGLSRDRRSINILASNGAVDGAQASGSSGSSTSPPAEKRVDLDQTVGSGSAPPRRLFPRFPISGATGGSEKPDSS